MNSILSLECTAALVVIIKWFVSIQELLQISPLCWQSRVNWVWLGFAGAFPTCPRAFSPLQQSRASAPFLNDSSSRKRQQLCRALSVCRTRRPPNYQYTQSAASLPIILPFTLFCCHRRSLSCRNGLLGNESLLFQRVCDESYRVRSWFLETTAIPNSTRGLWVLQKIRPCASSEEKAKCYLDLSLFLEYLHEFYDSGQCNLSYHLFFFSLKQFFENSGLFP